jgi:hypothetical protein
VGKSVRRERVLLFVAYGLAAGPLMLGLLSVLAPYEVGTQTFSGSSGTAGPFEMHAPLAHYVVTFEACLPPLEGGYVVGGSVGRTGGGNVLSFRTPLHPGGDCRVREQLFGFEVRAAGQYEVGWNLEPSVPDPGVVVAVRGSLFSPALGVALSGIGIGLLAVALTAQFWLMRKGERGSGAALLAPVEVPCAKCGRPVAVGAPDCAGCGAKDPWK